jgi:hypothetical protein
MEQMTVEQITILERFCHGIMEVISSDETTTDDSPEPMRKLRDSTRLWKICEMGVKKGSDSCLP